MSGGLHIALGGRPKSFWAHQAANGAAERQPNRNRAILCLWRTTDLSYAQIGARLGCARNAVAGVIDRDRRAWAALDDEAAA